jgi:hypothetical protein
MNGIGRWALGGAAAAALALGAGELAAALLGGGSPIAAIGAVVIDLQPPGAKDLMVELFGTATSWRSRSRRRSGRCSSAR